MEQCVAAGVAASRLPRHAVGEVAQQELLKQRAETAFADANEDVVHRGLEVVTGAVRVVQAGERAGAHVAQHIGVVRLPVAVVALADDHRGDGVQRAVDDRAAAVVEVARVLAEERGKDRRAEEGGGEVVAVGGGVALGVAGGAGAVAGEVALRLLDVYKRQVSRFWGPEGA